MFFRYSSSVVAPITCSSPRASAGLSMFEASIEPSAAPAPTTVCSSSMKTMSCPAFSVISSITDFRRSSNSPRYLVPATIPARSSGDQPLAGQRLGDLVVDDPLGDALDDRGLAHAGSPSRTGLFFVRRERISIVCSISSARPITGSSLPSRACSVRSRPYSSSVLCRARRAPARLAALDAADDRAAQLRVR